MDEACAATDSSLAREVHALLATRRRMGSFLEEPALGADFAVAVAEDAAPPRT